MSKDCLDISQTGDTRRRKLYGKFEIVISAITFVLIIVFLLYPLALADSWRPLITEKDVYFDDLEPHSKKYKVTFFWWWGGGNRCSTVI